jgi:hypothetical protein
MRARRKTITVPMAWNATTGVCRRGRLTVPELSDQQQKALLAALWAAIGPENFDTTTVLCEARYQPELMATIEAVVPHCKYRSGYMRGFLRDRPLRAVLTALAEQHFDTDEHGWWWLKADEHLNGSRLTTGPRLPHAPIKLPPTRPCSWLSPRAA